ncbi:MAG TPA: antibiotic biosynthesis monooxygenase family protein [Anaeromyxobacteraceae bacterium]|nr:antibiotic biosynthesis monooxygenase family protein [Anaeromyxobacteraceae bacterium]
MRYALLAAGLLLAACAHHGPAAPAIDPVPAAPRPGIARVWHGRVPAARAGEYAAYLASAITQFRTFPGNLGYELLRDDAGPEAHFLVVSYWTTKDALRAYAGDDLTKHRPWPRDPEFLVEPEPTVRNYQLDVRDLAQ